MGSTSLSFLRTYNLPSILTPPEPIPLAVRGSEPWGPSLSATSIAITSMAPFSGTDIPHMLS
jgi:hypothetical protein